MSFLTRPISETHTHAGSGKLFCGLANQKLILLGVRGRGEWDAQAISTETPAAGEEELMELGGNKQLESNFTENDVSARHLQTRSCSRFQEALLFVCVLFCGSPFLCVWSKSDQTFRFYMCN